MSSGRMFLKTKPALCTTCNRCSLTCAYNKYNVTDPGLSAIRVEHDLPDSFKVKLKVCLQCKKAACIEACPSGALSKNEDGIVVLDQEKCDGCSGDYRCVAACKFDGIHSHPEHIFPIKCDLCGGDPLCVKQCPVSIIKIQKI